MFRSVVKKWNPSVARASVWLGAGLVLCGAAFAQEGGKAPGDKPEKGEKPITLKVVPESVSMSMNASYDEAGEDVQSNNAQLEFSFRLKLESGAHGHKVCDATVTKFLTDTGEDMTGEIQDHSSRTMSAPGDLLQAPGQAAEDGGPEEGYSVNVYAPIPDKPMRKARVEGVADVLVRSGPMQRLALGELDAISGKRIKIEGTGGDWVKIKAVKTDNQKLVKLTCTQETLSKLVKVYFFTAQGELIPSQFHDFSERRANKPGTVTISGMYPEGTRVVMILCPEAKLVKVKFEAKDIPMPAMHQETAEGFDVVMKPEPIDEGFALEDLVPKLK